MDIFDLIAYMMMFGTFGLAALCAFLFREELVDRCLAELDRSYRRYIKVRHIAKGVVKAFREEREERAEKRRDYEIMKLQRRQILDSARLQELQSSRK